MAMFRPRPRSSTTPRRDRVAGHQHVVERQHLVADDLAGFMAFPGDDENIAATQLSNRGANSLAALADFDGVRRGGDARIFERIQTPADFLTDVAKARL